MAIDERRLDEARRIFLAVNRGHDGRDFSQFSDRGWLYGDEIKYKHRVWYRANDILDLPSWSKLTTGEGEICRRVTKAFEAAENLVLRRWGDVGYRGWSEPPDGQMAELEELTRRMMTAGESRDDVVSHFDTLCEFLRRHQRPCQWPPMSYLLFLRDKEHFFPVHPGEFQALLENLAVEATISGHCNGENLAVLLQVADEIAEDLRDGGYQPRDAIDVQSFMWVVATNLGVEVARPIAEPDWDRERERRNRASLQQQATGLRGERHVYYREREHLLKANRPDLADLVELVSSTMSDGGYDVRSFESDGSEIHIEVKTTTRSIADGVTVFLSARERERSEEDPSWRLCLVHDVGGELRVVCQSPLADVDHFVWRPSGWELDIAPGALQARP